MCRLRGFGGDSGFPPSPPSKNYCSILSTKLIQGGSAGLS